MFIKHFKHYSIKVYLETFSDPKDRVKPFKMILMFTGIDGSDTISGQMLVSWAQNKIFDRFGEKIVYQCFNGYKDSVQ